MTTEIDVSVLGPKERAAYFLGNALGLLHSAAECFRRAGEPQLAADARALALKVDALSARAFPEPGRKPG